MRLRKLLSVLFLENAVQQQGVQLFSLDHDANLVSRLALIHVVLIVVVGPLFLPKELLEQCCDIIIHCLDLVLLLPGDDPNVGVIFVPALKLINHLLEEALLDAGDHDDAAGPLVFEPDPLFISEVLHELSVEYCLSKQRSTFMIRSPRLVMGRSY